MSTNASDFVVAGRDALAKGNWEEARQQFEQALSLGETPEALEGLGVAAFLLDDASTRFSARERAYQLYRERDDRLGAVRVGTALAWDYLAFRGEPAVANGWIQRCRRLLESIAPAAEHGWLWLREGEIALSLHFDVETAIRLSKDAIELGRSLGLVDLEMVALSLYGLALVSRGNLHEGMACLDEATTAATSGEMTSLDAVVPCCNLISACERVQDFDRAAQWCDKVKEFCKRWRIHGLFALCRTEYAEVLMWRGAWKEAEPELIGARDELARLSPGRMDEALVRLGQLRCHQGRFEEAQSLFEQLRHHPRAQLGLAEVAFETGDYSAASSLIERYLRRVPVENQAWRVAGLELAIRTYIAQDMPDRAGPMLDELCTIALHVNTFPLQATAHVCRGLVAAALGDNETALHHFEDAADLFERCGIPFESARARLHLARTLFSLGKRGIAEKELQSSMDTFEKLGAAHLIEEARNLPHLPASNNHSSGLSPREVEVLQLVAQGLSNKEIAAHLHLSEHTVHRHVQNILAKLDLSSRAAAVAFAAQHHLL